jgi:CTP synthase
MIAAAQWARTKNISYLGICFGFQIASIEYARNVCGIPNATSSEFDPRASDPVIIPMEEIDKEVLGGTMRLGLQPTILQPGTEWSKLRALYDRATEQGEAAPSHDPTTILERHRHRYEINPQYISQFSEHGLNFIGKDDKGLRMEMFELKSDSPNAFYCGVQYHPEYISKVLRPSPVYLGFVAASAGCLDELLGHPKSQ